MHATLVTVDIHGTRDETEKILREFTIPMAKSLDGFVRGAWLRADDGASGRGVVLWDTKEHALAAAERISQGPPVGAPVTLRSVDLFEVVAEA